MRARDYDTFLTDDPITEFDNLPTQTIDQAVNTIHNHIQLATEAICERSTTRAHHQYKPTQEIRGKMNEYQRASQSHYQTVQPPVLSLQTLRRGTIDLMLTHKSHIWGTLVRQANQYKKESGAFWRKIRQLLESDNPSLTCLIHTFLDDDDEEQQEKLEDPQEQADLISAVWKKTLTASNSRAFNNIHFIRVNQWTTENAASLFSTPLIDLTTLQDDHPLTRPITMVEMRGVIKKNIQDKRHPEPSGIKAKQIKFLPGNFLESLLNLFNAMLASGYIPLAFKSAKMIFIPKPKKDPHQPGNYHPVSLLDTIGKCFEKIMSNRLNFYMECNNLFTEKQFGFRAQRSIKHAINIIYDAVRSIRQQKQVALIATRDVHKAFDSLWHDGLVYKLAEIPAQNWTLLRLSRNFLKNRQVTPSFKAKAAAVFTPTAGVPMGRA
nr:uncharacterized protein LOC123770609 [Procambarus clarkii]